MEESILSTKNNMNRLVCILTAGKGTRMGLYASYLNKAILPIKEKAVISHIIEKFPKKTEFIIGLGHLGNQVQDYLEIAHADTHFHFVTIGKYEGKGSGPGYSLLQCKEKLKNPFYFVSCDTLWSNELDFNAQNNWMGTAQVGADETQNYCNFEVKAGRIVSIKDKQKVDPLTHEAFVGLCYVKDTKVFFQGLENLTLKSGEVQVSNGIQALIDNSIVETKHIDWIDVGGEANYKREVSKFENYDFSKSNEALYILNKRVIKFFAEKSFAEKRVEKAALNPSVFPHIDRNKNNFFSYSFINGKTLYHSNTFPIFTKLLIWLEKKLWKRVGNVDGAAFRAICKKFYYDKTLERLDKYYKKYSYSDTETMINGQKIPKTEELLKQIPWDSIFEGIPSFIHGDLQFDNVLYNHQTDSFVLLDWRQDFGGVVEYGDMYYDIAKMRGGIILNYDLIKLNLLKYEEGRDGIYFDFAQRYLSDKYLQILDIFIQKKGLDVRKVQILVGLIYLNMSPLHHFPFDKMLYSLGRQVLFSTLRLGNGKK